MGGEQPRSDVQLRDLERWRNSASAWFHCTDNLSWHRGPCSSKTSAHRREEPWDVSSRVVKHMDKYSAWWKNKMKEEKEKKAGYGRKGLFGLTALGV